jgi:hypothetical protein
MNRIILLFLFLSGCTIDFTYKNFTIKNRSKNTIIYFLDNDSIFGLSVVNDIIKNNKLNDYGTILKPGEKSDCISPFPTNVLFGNDTCYRYIFIIDLDKIKKIESNKRDSVKIRVESIKLFRLKYSDLKMKKFLITYP